MKLPHPSIEIVYSKKMGIKLPIPKTESECQIYPAQILIFDVGQSLPSQTIKFSIQGPVENFLVKLNLHVGRIEVSFQDQVGFYSYLIEARHNTLQFIVDRTPPLGLKLRNGATALTLQRKETYSLPVQLEEIEEFPEVLELGVYKKLNWQRVEERMDLCQIVPIWMRLGHFFKDKVPQEFSGTLRALHSLDQAIQSRESNRIASVLTLLLQIGFEGMLTPRMFDVRHQGILEESDSTESALPLLGYGAKLLRSLFIQEKGNQLSILPCIPPEFRVGRFYTLTAFGDEILYEWTNGRLKILSMLSHSTRKVILHLPKEIQHARLRTHTRDRGIRLMNGGEVQLTKDQKIFLDRFEK